jgi:hypothetical protein
MLKDPELQAYMYLQSKVYQSTEVREFIISTNPLWSLFCQVITWCSPIFIAFLSRFNRRHVERVYKSVPARLIKSQLTNSDNSRSEVSKHRTYMLKWVSVIQYLCLKCLPCLFGTFNFIMFAYLNETAYCFVLDRYCQTDDTILSFWLIIFVGLVYNTVLFFLSEIL